MVPFATTSTPRYLKYISLFLNRTYLPLSTNEPNIILLLFINYFQLSPFQHPSKLKNYLLQFFAHICHQCRDISKQLTHLPLRTTVNWEITSLITPFINRLNSHRDVTHLPQALQTHLHVWPLTLLFSYSHIHLPLFVKFNASSSFPPKPYICNTLHKALSKSIKDRY